MVQILYAIRNCRAQDGDDYYSKNYDDNGDMIIIDIDLAIGSVEIK